MILDKNMVLERTLSIKEMVHTVLYLLSHTHYQVFVDLRTAQAKPAGSLRNRGVSLSS